MTDEVGSVVGAGCSFEGKLALGSAGRIDGHVRGEIRCDGSLVIGPRGRVQAEVHAFRVLVEGEFSGRLCAKERIEIAPGGSVEGTLEAPRLIVRDGASVSARVQMGEGAG